MPRTSPFNSFYVQCPLCLTAIQYLRLGKHFAGHFRYKGRKGSHGPWTQTRDEIQRDRLHWLALSTPEKAPLPEPRVVAQRLNN